MPDFIIQKLLSTDSKIYCSQGEISGGCVTHAAAAALSVLGIIGAPSRISNPRCEPNARRFWLKLKDAYADGIDLPELARRLDELDLGIRVTQLSGAHARVLAFTEMAVSRGNPFVISYKPGSHPRSHHAVMVAGIAGKVRARRFVPQSLLINDSSGDHPGVGPHNARIDYLSDSRCARSSLYVTAWEQYRIALTSAVSFQLAKPAQPDRKPP